MLNLDQKLYDIPSSLDWMRLSGSREARVFNILKRPRPLGCAAQSPPFTRRYDRRRYDQRSMKFSLIPRHPRSRRWLPAAAAAPLIAFAAGCASPGPPQPPSLNLPAVVKDLAAERLGDVVHLHWTTPEMTTDRIEVKGAITAEICRITVTAPAPKTPACTPITRLPVKPGPTEGAET